MPKLLLKAVREKLESSSKTSIISHLFYADDILLGSRATKKEALEITKILKLFEGWSGQRINVDKFNVLFSPKLKKKIERLVRRLLQVKEMENKAIYLRN